MYMDVRMDRSAWMHVRGEDPDRFDRLQEIAPAFLTYMDVGNAGYAGALTCLHSHRPWRSQRERIRREMGFLGISVKQSDA